MNTELMEALNILEKEKDINREVLLEAIENSLLSACKQQYGKSDNIKVSIDRETCDFHVCAMKNVVRRWRSAWTRRGSSTRRWVWATWRRSSSR